MHPPSHPVHHPVKHHRDPLHGVTLESIVRELEAHFGWAGLAQRIPVRCFTHDPSINSSLKFLRKTPWAREKVEGLYLFMLREQRRDMNEVPLGNKADSENSRSHDAEQLQAMSNNLGISEAELTRILDEVGGDPDKVRAYLNTRA